MEPFKLERYFAKHEFTVPHLMCCSDCEPLHLKELLTMADSDSLNLWKNLSLAYTESRGHPLLLEAVASLYKGMSPQNCLITVPEEGIFLAMTALLRERDHVIVTFPGYQSLYQVAQSRGCEISRWTPEEQDQWVFDCNQLAGMIRDNTRMIVINFPHNPTGVTISPEDLSQIVNIAREKNIVLFSDEMYRFLEYDPKDRLPSATELYENAISLSGLSKAFSLPGLRIGWLTSQNPDFLKKISHYKDYTTICSSAPSEILAIMALRAREKIVGGNLKILRDNLEHLNHFFKDNRSLFKWLPPKAGTVAFPRVLFTQNSEIFCEEVIRGAGVLLAPSTQFNYQTNHIRIGLGRKDLRESLDKLSAFIDQNYKIE